MKLAWAIAVYAALGHAIASGAEKVTSKQKAFTPFSDEVCTEHFTKLSSLASAEREEIKTLAANLALFTSLRYIVGMDTVISSMKNGMGGYAFSNELDDLRQRVSKSQVAYIKGYLTYQEALNRPLRNKYIGDDAPMRATVKAVSMCTFQEIYKSPNPDTAKRLSQFADAASSVLTARIGNFQVTREQCVVTPTVGTPSKLYEPEQWEGSTFVVIDARFKNLDSEGRLPNEGRLIIKSSDGRELIYDSTETIIAQGYGIYFKSINPLVTMPTKIVYRIPTDISGEVMWQPGRNPDSKKLWCTFLPPSSGDS